MNMTSVVILITIIFGVKSAGHNDPRYQWQVDASVACPCGLISMGYGPLDLLPHYYQLCDGTNGTPDMRNRFPLDAGVDYQFGNTGGSHSFQITVDNLQSHNHAFKGVHTDTNGAHTHTHDLTTTSVPPHTHGVSITTSASDGHGHDWSGSMYPENKHTHGIPQRTTDAKGNHDHQMTAFFDDESDIIYSLKKDKSEAKKSVKSKAKRNVKSKTKKSVKSKAKRSTKSKVKKDDSKDDNEETNYHIKNYKPAVAGVKAEYILDGDQKLSDIKAKYPDKTVYDHTNYNGNHMHTIAPINTSPGSAHTHGMMGTVSAVSDHSHTGTTVSAESGAHNHDISGTILGGTHDHTINGMTENTGHGKPSNFIPPYIAVYFICCVRDAPIPVQV